jgi:hypothetical protein
MSNKTIAKFAGLVILFACVSSLLTSCSPATPSGRYKVNASELSPDYEKPVVVGRIESPEVNESSGVASSLCQSGVLWTHNDSGDGAFIYAMNLSGKHLGKWQVTNARNHDWEDMAAYKDASGTCYLYIGEIGNNDRALSSQRVYRVKEPTVRAEAVAASGKNALQTEPAEILEFKYSDSRHDAETLMVEPKTGAIYVLTKRFDGPAAVFKIAPSFGSRSVVQAERIADISLPAVPNGLLTGGAISPDGKQVVLCDYSSAYVIDMGTSANFDDGWKQKPIPVEVGERKQGEAITFSPDGNSIIATSEKSKSPVIQVKRK